MLGLLAPEVVTAVEALISEEVERRLAQPERLLLTVPEFAKRVGLSALA